MDMGRHTDRGDRQWVWRCVIVTVGALTWPFVLGVDAAAEGRDVDGAPAHVRLLRSPWSHVGQPVGGSRSRTGVVAFPGRHLDNSVACSAWPMVPAGQGPVVEGALVRAQAWSAEGLWQLFAHRKGGYLHLIRPDGSVRDLGALHSVLWATMRSAFLYADGGHVVAAVQHDCHGRQCLSLMRVRALDGRMFLGPPHGLDGVATPRGELDPHVDYEVTVRAGRALVVEMGHGSPRLHVFRGMHRVGALPLRAPLEEIPVLSGENTLLLHDGDARRIVWVNLDQVQVWRASIPRRDMVPLFGRNGPGGVTLWFSSLSGRLRQTLGAGGRFLDDRTVDTGELVPPSRSRRLRWERGASRARVHVGDNRWGKPFSVSWGACLRGEPSLTATPDGFVASAVTRDGSVAVQRVVCGSARPAKAR